MACNPQALAVRPAAFLGEDVACAVRVRKGPPQGSWARSEISGPSGLPALGFPIVPIFRSLKRRVSDMIGGDDGRSLILAFTTSGDRVVLGRSRFRSRRPTGPVRHLDRDHPLAIELPLLFEELIPELRIGDEFFIVNSVDFGVLTRALVAGDVDEPALAAQVRPFYEQTKRMKAGEPETIRSMINPETRPSRPRE